MKRNRDIVLKSYKYTVRKILAGLLIFMVVLLIAVDSVDSRDKNLEEINLEEINPIDVQDVTEPKPEPEPEPEPIQESKPVEEILELQPITIAAGGYHSFAITEDGKLWGWGDNTHGQLGDETIECRGKPEIVMDDIVSVIAGEKHSLAIKTDGSLWAWGSNWAGQLGIGNSVDNLKKKGGPKKVLDNVVSMAAGVEHSLAVKSDGSLWAWGYNRSGQFGNGGAEYNSKSPLKIMDGIKFVTARWVHCYAITIEGDLLGWGESLPERFDSDYDDSVNSPEKIMEDVVSVATGKTHTLAIKNDGSLWAWGQNAIGQLGDGTNNDSKEPIKIMDDVLSISAGNITSYAIKNDGTLWAWGYVGKEDLDNSTIVGYSNVPVKIMTDAVSIAGGGYFSLALQKDGALFTWGDNSSGQLGNGTVTSTITSTIVSEPRKVMDGIISAAAGAYHSAAVKNDGSLWIWGWNGGGFTNGLNLHVPVKFMDNVASVGTGLSWYEPGMPISITYVIKSDRTLWAWGGYNSYELGGNYFYSKVPTELMDNVASAVAGGTYIFALKTDGSLWLTGNSWGDDLGDTSKAEINEFVKILDDVASFDVGGSHCLAVKKDGSLWVWGSNISGQLGDGKQENIIELLPVKIMDNVISATARYGCSYVIKSDGSLWAWGSNISGQLGDGTKNDKLLPVKIMDDVLYSDGSRAIKMDGSLWAWGSNENGRIGDGSTNEYVYKDDEHGYGYTIEQTVNNDRPTPVKIMDNVSVIMSSFAIKTDGSLWAWGDNKSGKLGNGTATIYDDSDAYMPILLENNDVLRPEQIVGMDNVTQISSGEEHTLAIKTDGSLWAWGSNWGGQLGIGNSSKDTHESVLDGVKVPMRTAKE